MAALGGSLPLNPPAPLYEVTQDDVERAGRQLQRFLDEYAETVKSMSTSAAWAPALLATTPPRLSAIFATTGTTILLPKTDPLP